MRISIEVFHEGNKEAEGMRMGMRLRIWVRTHLREQNIIRNHPYYIHSIAVQES